MSHGGLFAQVEKKLLACLHASHLAPRVLHARGRGRDALGAQILYCDDYQIVAKPDEETPTYGIKGNL
jgi:hypothetical protein